MEETDAIKSFKKRIGELEKELENLDKIYYYYASNCRDSILNKSE